MKSRTSYYVLNFVPDNITCTKSSLHCLFYKYLGKIETSSQDYFYKRRIGTLLEDIRKWKIDFVLQYNRILKEEKNTGYFSHCLLHLFGLAFSFPFFISHTTSAYVSCSTLHVLTFSFNSYNQRDR